MNVCLCFCFTGSIHCTSSPKHPPDALLKATAQHRRARSAAWSYRFPVNEEWCELVVSLPTAILLQEVHIQPHSTGLSSKCFNPYLAVFVHLAHLYIKERSSFDLSFSQKFLPFLHTGNYFDFFMASAQTPFCRHQLKTRNEHLIINDNSLVPAETQKKNSDC